MNSYPMHRERWSEAELDFLRREWPGPMRSHEIARKLRRTMKAVRWVASKRGLRKGREPKPERGPSRRDQQRQEIVARQDLARNLVEMGVSLPDIADRLGRSVDTVKGYLRAGNVPTRRAIPITEEIRETVRRMYPTSVHMDEITKATGRKRNSIIGLAHRMGLRRPERARTWA